MTTHRPATLRRWARFIEMLTETANVSLSARAAGFARPRVYALRAANPDFAAAWDEALATACDRLLEEARRRAVDGVARAVYYRGRIVGEIRYHSDRLLMFLLKLMRPAVYDPKHRRQPKRVVPAPQPLPPPAKSRQSAADQPPIPVDTRTGPGVLYPCPFGPPPPSDSACRDPFWHRETNRYAVARCEHQPGHEPAPVWYTFYKVRSR